MKTKFIFSLLTALLFNFATSGLFAQSIGIDHNLMFGIQMGLSLVPLQLTGCLADGLNKEIWIPEIIEKFYPETSFVSDSRDFSMWTDNEYLNLQEAGIDPRVFIDNEVYPIPVVARGDKPYKIPMKRFDTENTVHINAIEIEESAEKRRSVAAGHQKSLQMQFSELAIYNWAPKKDSETTPVIKINDGNASKQGTGYVAMTYEKVLALSTQLDMMLVPKKGVSWHCIRTMLPTCSFKTWRCSRRSSLPVPCSASKFTSLPWCLNTTVLRVRRWNGVLLSAIRTLSPPQYGTVMQFVVPRAWRTCTTA